jgi:NAD-dependent dihydropyrimidine dehydrogenase PreA subunit
MPFFIAGDCLDVLDKSCTEECPVDCIYEGDRKMYINPKECIDCGACEPVCPVSAVVSDLPPGAAANPWRADNAAFFAVPLPGRQTAIGTPGSAAKIGRIGADTPLAASHPATAS